MDFKSQAVESIHMTLVPEPDPDIDTKSEEQKWQKIMTLRDQVLRVLEELRQNQDIASNQEAVVTIAANDDEMIATINELGVENFAALCIVSRVNIEKADEQKVTAQKSTDEKCQRCWNFWPTVGKSTEYPDLCARCVEVVSKKA